ncbi:RNA polymerase recycling motor HelD [Enterococcus italicus]|uniref:UvrD-like helicase ATP-binding domain-containing protein n=1 Tax=Enterococcus italicus (strain DSM 15952 / CCUG 50447 / LMG 22039 / TP 1.5) TaxID=888064 RepID=E6LGR1_ENTI1|nr:RNA polymerase recycling motor HelD [Enterococcus italicus]EFU73672.1 hypothetical protein HMPREF9088_1551 [Enterococcus italicus DSM 15952]OJG59637.1 DNA helicase [Enterococcus italicus DSM 15952]
MNERDYERKHLSKTIDLIAGEEALIEKQQQELTTNLQSKLKELTDNKINTGNEEAFYESVIAYQEHEKEVQLTYQTTEAKQKRLTTLATMKNAPYFARIDFTEDQDAKETLYLGIASLRDMTDEPVIVDWRAPIANLYYEGELGETYYETDQERFDVTLSLKRQFKIQDGQLISMVDTSEVINDEFLLEILDEASSSQMKNIVSTIQKSQNEIIRDTENRIVLIEGIAGSGKTSALLQRVAFLLYRHRKWLKDSQVLLFSPNHLFSDYISMVLPSLGESEIPTKTFVEFLHELLPNYTLKQKDTQEDTFLTGDENKIETTKNSLAYLQKIKPYIQSIQAFGPLFRNISLNGKVYIDKKTIRQWYLQTNDLLPLYQRTQLLQEKLLKKLGGLVMDEMRQEWVKELADEKLIQYMKDHPHQEYTEASEKTLLKKIKRSIVQKRFAAMKRTIQSFRFINLPMQYFHFLQQVTPTLEKDLQVAPEQWAEHLNQLKQDFRDKALASEDAVLFFLLLKAVFPIDVTQKARFIFIDEMQDFPPAQVALLKELYPDAAITLCGDLNQKVLGNDTIVDHLTNLFPTQKVKRYQLTTSYRSTAEITAVANQFLSQDDTVKLTARNGEKPLVCLGSSEAQRTYLLNELAQRQSQPSHWRTAIITKTVAEAQNLYEQFDEDTKQFVQLIDTEDTFMKRSTIIIPAFLAKGLEFDEVYVWNISSDFTSTHDQLILYTMISRAMHQLTILSDNQSPLLSKIDKESVTFKPI